MKRPRQAFIVLICAFVLAGCGFLFPFAELRYKLAVDVDIGGTIYHGEGVYLVAFQSQGPILIGNTPQWSVGVVGQAFPIELGDRGMMFVLMHPDLVHRAFRSGRKSYLFRTAEAGRQALLSYFDFAVNDLPNGLAAQAKIEAFAKSNTSVDMPPTALPLLVRFRNNDDPETIERVDPENLAASLGANAKITRVTASITRSNVTTGIEHYLKWLPALHGSIVSDRVLPFNDILRLNSRAFIQGNPR